MPRTFPARLVVLLGLLGLALTGQASELAVETPWARATIGNTPNGVAYFSVTNHGTVADRLVGASTIAAGHAALHTHTMRDGMMRMVAVPSIEIAPGESVALAPGGLHVMIMGLKAPLREGDKLELTLTFERAGDVTVEVPVLAATSMGPGPMMHGEGHGSGHEEAMRQHYEAQGMDHDAVHKQHESMHKEQESMHGEHGMPAK